MRRLKGLVGAALRLETVADVRRRIEEAGVTASYFLCATPRSGSTVLADALAASGTVGKAGEYFNVRYVPGGGTLRVGDYLAVACAHEARGTGVLGTKLHWDQQASFLSMLRRLRGARGLSDGALVERVFPEPRYLWLTRADVVAQAVSWWRAKLTRVWFPNDEQRAEPVFDFEKIDERLRLIETQNACWCDWFKANAIVPFRVEYEALVSAPEETITAVLSFLAASVPDDADLRLRTPVQADELNEEWIHRYHELAATR